jgi:hypothetical protein
LLACCYFGGETVESWTEQRKAPPTLLDMDGKSRGRNGLRGWLLVEMNRGRGEAHRAEEAGHLREV